MRKKKNILHERAPDYGKAEADLLREGLKRTYAERFEMMTTLMKMGIMLKNARVTHKPLTVRTVTDF